MCSDACPNDEEWYKQNGIKMPIWSGSRLQLVQLSSDDSEQNDNTSASQPATTANSSDDVGNTSASPVESTSDTQPVDASAELERVTYTTNPTDVNEGNRQTFEQRWFQYVRTSHSLSYTP